MRINDLAIYLTDNGRALCGRHLGATAKATGRDISGQRIEVVTPELAAEASADGWTVTCETCGRAASRLHLAD